MILYYSSKFHFIIINSFRVIGHGHFPPPPPLPQAEPPSKSPGGIGLTRASKKLYYQSYFNQNASNIKKTWEGIRELIGHQKKSKSINALRDNRSSPLVYEPDKIANIMNSHFALCGHRLAAKLPHSGKHYSAYLTNRNAPGSFAFHLVETAEIITEIIALPSNKSYGFYSCPSKLLKRTRHVLCVPLVKILNNSIERGIYPEKLKIAKVAPIFKSDDETDTNNYRPISLLSIFTRIFEKLTHKRLSSYLDINNIICESQNGFRQQHSTEHAILDIINRIQSYMDKKLFSCGVLSKAFDTVDHDILLGKLNHYRIRRAVNKRFASYLKGRFQTTKIKNSISEKREILCGVPQGSVLGPLLFLVNLNPVQAELFLALRWPGRGPESPPRNFLIIWCIRLKLGRNTN